MQTIIQASKAVCKRFSENHKTRSHVREKYAAAPLYVFTDFVYNKGRRHESCAAAWGFPHEESPGFAGQDNG